MLQIIDLSVHGTCGERLESLRLDLRPGEVHVITGPHDGGRGLLLDHLCGVRRGDVQGVVLLDGVPLDPRRASREGVFVPPAPPPGYSSTVRDFLRQASDRRRRELGLPRSSKRSFQSGCDRACARLAYSSSVLDQKVESDPTSVGWKQALVLLVELCSPRFVLLRERDVEGEPAAMAALAIGIRLLRASDRAFLVSTGEGWLAENLLPDEWYELRRGILQRPGRSEVRPREAV